MSFRQGARQFFERRGPKLPYDAEVEYLESDGYAYISTGYAPADSSTVVFDGLVGFASGSSGRRFLYADGNASVTHYSEFNSYNLFGGYSAYVQAQLTAGTMYCAKTTITASNYSAEMTVGGVKYTSSTSSFAASHWRNLVLFRLTDSYRGSGHRIGRIKFLVNDVVKFYFIPVRFTNEQNQSEGAMYDRVSKQLFRNAGTGAFVIGPDK